jgi:hypothetical protein
MFRPPHPPTFHNPTKSYWRVKIPPQGLPPCWSTCCGWGGLRALWPLVLCWRERKPLAGSPKPDRSKGRSQTKCSPLILQVGGWAWCHKLRSVKSDFLRNLPKKMWPRFFKKCRATEKDERKDYEVPLCVIFSIFLQRDTFWIKIFFSAPCSQIPSSLFFP